MNALCRSFFVSILIPMAASAYAVVDQQHVPETANGRARVGDENAVDWAQTFTVGITGTLTGFDVWVERNAATTLPLLYDIRMTIGGVPTEPDFGANILASGSIDASQLSVEDGSFGVPPVNLPHVDLDDLSFPVSAGTILALVLRSDAPVPDNVFAYSWYRSTFEDYPAGARYLRTTAEWLALLGPDSTAGDLFFRTYVNEIPEPATVSLCAAIIAAFGIFRLRNVC